MLSGFGNRNSQTFVCANLVAHTSDRNSKNTGRLRSASIIANEGVEDEFACDLADHVTDEMRNRRISSQSTTRRGYRVPNQQLVGRTWSQRSGCFAAGAAPWPAYQCGRDRRCYCRIAAREPCGSTIMYPLIDRTWSRVKPPPELPSCTIQSLPPTWLISTIT